MFDILTNQPLEIVRQGLLSVGYQENLLIRNYAFSDYLSNRNPQRYIHLAAFGQKPLSPRSACFGAIVTANDSVEAIKPYRALGAPQILAVYPQGEVGFWKIHASNEPTLTHHFKISDLPNVLAKHQDEVNPEQVLRAKSIGFRQPLIQASLFDFDPDLVPVLEEKLGRKLDSLICRVLAESRELYLERYNDELPFVEMARLVFRLVAAKLLIDREHQAAVDWKNYDARAVIKAVESFYFESAMAESVLTDERIQETAWEKILSAFSFQHISVEVLAYIYENTLVSDEDRKKAGIHATPPAIAEYIVKQLPFEKLDLNKCRVFEPFSGHSPFLVAALGRLRPLLLPLGMDETQRHEYFKRALSGMEAESFAREVGQRSLMLADYPNKDHWDIVQGDVYSSPKFRHYLEQAQVVLSNPPFERFKDDYRQSHSIPSFKKGAEALLRVLEFPAQMLGFILPRTFINGQDYQECRRKLDETYNDIEVVSLPDNTFAHSDVEPVLIIAHGKRSGHPIRRSAFVEKKDFKKFKRTYELTWKIVNPSRGVSCEPDPVLWYTPLYHVWDALSHLPRLESIADPHRGIEYKDSVRKHESLLFSNEWKPGFEKGLRNVPDSGLEPYVIKKHIYLNMDENLMLYEAYKLPWEQRKVIVNAARIKRYRWVMAAAVDEDGLFCYQNFDGIWPKTDIPLEVIAALLNGPVANAYLSDSRKWAGLQVRIINKIPVPVFSQAQIQSITSLVKTYKDYRQRWLNYKGPLLDQSESATDFEQICRDIAWQIDAEILAAYDLPLELERELLDYFEGYERPGPLGFELSSLIQALPMWLTHNLSKPGSQLVLDRHRKNQAARKHLQSWLEEDEQAEGESWKELQEAIDEDRLSYRKLFKK